MLRCWDKQGYGAPKCNKYFQTAYTACPPNRTEKYYEARRDDLWWGYPYPLQEKELKPGDEIKHREKKQNGHH